jgi:ceramide synthetase
VGCIVMALHDFNDVFMEGAKLCNYAGWEAASTAMFVTFMASWAVTRLGIFPWVVVRSTLAGSWALVGTEYTLTAYMMFNGLLLVLCVLHCYWFSLILKIAYNKVTTGATSDVREEDE